MASSIAEFGFTNPILVGADNDIIAGRGRLLAAKKLELKDSFLDLDMLLCPMRRLANF
ncbi:ParB N-terminal domain-containing protein [Pseudovibrio sp. Ad26]|uniref:ParB N-terminal domain-containing protein n=1 Tax=Pseudovibrio sp. Ad26 TaxID=989410 RepID=UPI0023B9518F|nr:ParB N-terminal domain-containing protein [Pseudovibrio sp. Ad26]